MSPPMQLLPETPPACLRIVFPLPMKVPFLDLKAHHAPLRGNFKSAIAEVIDSGIFAGGPAVVDFEEAFAAFVNVTTRLAWVVEPRQFGWHCSPAASVQVMKSSQCRVPL